MFSLVNFIKPTSWSSFHWYESWSSWYIQFSDDERIIITEDWYNEQMICGEEHVKICCTKDADPEQCKDFDTKSCDEDNSEVYAGWKPSIQIPTDSEKAGVTVPPKHRGKCRQQECKKTKRVKRKGLVPFCCDMVKVGSGFSCPTRKAGKCRQL